VHAIVDDDGKRPPRYYFEFGEHKVEIKYVYKNTIPPSGRYSISCDELNNFIDTDKDHKDEERDHVADETAFGRKLSVSLTRLINQEQAFSVVPARPGIVYSHSHFFKPEVNESLLSILEGCDDMNDVVSEKGDTQLKKKGDWARRTQFGLVYTWAAVKKSSSLTGIAQDIARCSVIVCDDRQSEAVDFFGLDEERRRIYIIHAKAENGTPHVSARKLQAVARQAQASLAFAGSSRREFPFPADWKTDWSVRLKDAGKVEVKKPRLFKRPSKRMTAVDAHRHLTSALLDPGYTREVVVMTAGLLSKDAATQTFRSDDQTQNELQFIYFLGSVRTTFDRAGVRLRVVTNP
jgi:hypothetical protein